MKDRKPKKELKKNLTHDTLPATMGFVKEVRNELVCRMEAMEHRLDGKISGSDAKISGMDGKFSSLDAKVSGMDGRLSSLDAKVSGIDGRLSSLDAKVSETLAAVHRNQALMEEQRSENRIVLDGLIGLNRRVDGAEMDITELREEVRKIGASARA